MSFDLTLPLKRGTCTAALPPPTCFPPSFLVFHPFLSLMCEMRASFILIFFSFKNRDLSSILTQTSRVCDKATPTSPRCSPAASQQTLEPQFCFLTPASSAAGTSRYTSVWAHLLFSCYVRRIALLLYRHRHRCIHTHARSNTSPAVSYFVEERRKRERKKCQL